MERRGSESIEKWSNNGAMKMNFVWGKNKIFEYSPHMILCALFVCV